MRIRASHFLLFGAFALSACQTASDTQDAPTDSTLVKGLASERPTRSTAPAALDSQVAQGIPAQYVDRGVCPFECCTYGEWIAREPITVYQTERDMSDVAFTTESGEAFQGITGNVYIDPVGIAVATDTVTYGPSDDRQTLMPGDTVYVLSHIGEGVYHVLHGGEAKEVYAFWTESGLEPGGIKGELLREPRTEWWVQVRKADGETGWILMDSNGSNVKGVDACSGG